MDIVLVANSPGELSALVKPTAEELAKNPATRVILVLTPCQYTSGREMDYVKTLKGIKHIISAAEYKNWILRNQKPAITFDKNGLVLFLGGDLAHAVLVAKKIHYPAYAYIQDFIGWYGFYKKFFVPDQQSYDKFSRARKKIKIIGNLMVDSVADIPKWDPQKNVVTFLPGSRKWQIDHTTPIYHKIMQEIKKLDNNIEFRLVSSPFVEAMDIPGIKQIAFEDTNHSEMVITIPGTNTARLAAMGIPMLVIFPLDNPGVIPLEGLPHFISLIPYLGPKFKSFLINTVNKSTRFFALPNIKAQKELVKEIRGVIDPRQVAEETLTLLKDRSKRDQMSRDLIAAMGKTGASENLARELVL